MEGRTGSERRVWPGKTISPRPTKLKAWAYQNIRIGKIFNVVKGKRLTKANAIPGSINFIGSSASNHGITMKVGNTEALHMGNTITVSYNGSVGQAFYQIEKFWASDDINVLYPLFKMNEPIALYLCAAIRKTGTKYAYSYKWAKEIMENDNICLPVKENGIIDFEFMESRIREMEESRIREMDAYLQVTGFENCELTAKEQEAEKRLTTGKVRMQYFELSTLYEKVNIKNKSFDKRKDTSLQKSAEYSLPLINAKHGDNGIMFYGKEDLFPSVEMTIDIVQNGAIATGDVYAQPQKTGVLWDAYLIKAKAHKDTINTLLYFACVIEKTIKQKFSYDNKAVWDRVKTQKVLLPVNESNQIDFDFMDLYINAQMKLSIQKVKDWRAKEIDTTKSIVKADTDTYQAKPQMSYDEWQMEHDAPKMVAEEIVIPGSLEVRLQKTKREELLNGSLDLVLMYAIGPVARKKTESAGKIALGIKEENLSVEAIKAYESINYVMFHYWKNSEARPFKLISPTRLVSKEGIPEGYLVRQDKEAKQYLLMEYDADNPADFGEYDILKVQRKGTSRYIPFVCKVDSLKE